MEKVRPWCGQPSDRGRLKIRSDQITHSLFHSRLKSFLFCKSSLPQSFLFLLQDSLYGFPKLFTVTSEHIRLFTFQFFFCFYTFIVVGSVRQIKLTYVGFRAYVKIASRIVSYRIHALFISDTSSLMRVALLPSVPSTHHSHHPSPFTLSFQAYYLPFLQILPAVAFLFFFRTDCADSPDCLPILLSMSVFLLFIFLFSTFQLLVPGTRLS